VADVPKRYLFSVFSTVFYLFQEHDMSTFQESILPGIRQEDVDKLAKLLLDGATPAGVAGIDQDQLEALYALGHRLYAAGSYADAETIFSSLCLYDYGDRRFWMGLGASLQGGGKLEQAVDVYSMAGLRTSLKDPEPFYYAALCFLKLGNIEAVKATLDGIELMGVPGNAAHAAFKKKAADLREVIHLQLDGANAPHPTTTQ
jgi:type III secretion system low calcium response chaperone LcrH/SycD